MRIAHHELFCIFAPEIIKNYIMALITINSYDEFAAYLGKELGQSEWLEISQERINKFADATLDHQWIHVDTERAKVDSPYHSTIPDCPVRHRAEASSQRSSLVVGAINTPTTPPFIASKFSTSQLLQEL